MIENIDFRGVAGCLIILVVAGLLLWNYVKKKDDEDE